MRTREYKRLIILLIFGLTAAAILALTYYITNVRQTTAAQAADNFDQYCNNGVYYIPKDGKQISCGRAPNCGGTDFDSADALPFRDNAECWVEDYYGGNRCLAHCAGNIPLCCYRLEQTGDPMACPWPERGFCLSSQCNKIDLTKDVICGGGKPSDCNCGDPIGTYCAGECGVAKEQIPYIPLSQRLNGTSTLPTDTPIPPTATSTPPPQNTPTPSHTPIPTQPGGQAGQPTSPPNATWTPVPTWTQTPAQPGDNNTGFIGQGNQASTSQPTAAPTQGSIFTAPAFPKIEVKSPKELAQEVVNLETVQVLNETTDVPLEAPKKALTTIKAYDQKLEDTVESWIFRLRIWVSKTF